MWSAAIGMRNCTCPGHLFQGTCIYPPASIAYDFGGGQFASVNPLLHVKELIKIGPINNYPNVATTGPILQKKRSALDIQQGDEVELTVEQPVRVAKEGCKLKNYAVLYVAVTAAGCPGTPVRNKNRHVLFAL